MAVPGVLRAALEDIWASSLPASERRWLCRTAVACAVGDGAGGAGVGRVVESEEVSLGVVDAACRLAAAAWCRDRVPTGELAKHLRCGGSAGLELARRLSRASKARRLRAHPDPLLLQDLEAFLAGAGPGSGDGEGGEQVKGDTEFAEDEGREFETAEQEEKQLEEPKAEYDTLTKLVQEALGDKVERVSKVI